MTMLFIFDISFFDEPDGAEVTLLTFDCKSADILEQYLLLLRLTTEG